MQMLIEILETPQLQPNRRIEFIIQKIKLGRKGLKHMKFRDPSNNCLKL